MALEAEQLPLLESAAALTAAKVDLLPHQIVLTYRIAKASTPPLPGRRQRGPGQDNRDGPRPAGVGLAWRTDPRSDGRPAGLVENWRRELNETFNLDFEVFGSEGDVTDRKSNAFARHNRLIASIDTLKRPAASSDC